MFASLRKVCNAPRSLSLLQNTQRFNFADTKSSLKTYKITVEADHGKTLLKGEKTPSTEISAPLEHLLGALCACEASTAYWIAKTELKLNVKKIYYKKVEGDIDTRGFLGKEKDTKKNMFSKIRMEVELETDASEDKLEELKHQSHLRCPIHNMLHHAGVEFESHWKKV